MYYEVSSTHIVLNTEDYSVSTIVWEDPPEKATASRPRKWAQRLDDYRAKPGVWGRFDESFPQRQAYSLATRINTGKVAGIRPGEFKAKGLRKDGQYYVWVCYVGYSEPKS
jgi:hypothetical protein